MQLNVSKNEILGIGSYTPPDVSLPNFVVPPDPYTDEVQASQPDWFAEPPVPYTKTKDVVNGLVPKVRHLVHLGHPLTPSMTQGSIYRLVLDELEHTLNILGTKPLPPMARAEVTRTVIQPAVLYRLECSSHTQRALGTMTQHVGI